MSTNKEKLLESAQKFILKGQTDRAIKDYEQIVSLDPSDLRHRQRLAELLVKANRKDEAIQAFGTIAKHYADNAHYLKAIAVYKQIQKLDQTNPDISLTLASLNEKQGLAGNAIAEYTVALNAFDKAGEKAKVLKILGSMQAIDPQNLNIHLRLAEAIYTSGDKKQALAEFTNLALTLKKRSDDAGYQRISERVATLFPNHPDFNLEILEQLLNNGNAQMAIPQLQHILDQNRDHQRAWELLLDAYSKTAQSGQLRDACRQMSGLFPDNPAPRLMLLQSLLAEGLHDETLAEAASQAEPLGRLAPHELEEFYQQLLGALPDHPQVLHALRTLYQLTGSGEKLAEMTTRLQHAPAGHAPMPLPPSAPAADQPATIAAAPATAVAETLPPMAEWEEELDLTELEEELPVGYDPDDLPPPAFGDEPQPTIQSTEQVELQLDLSGGAFPWESPPPGPAPVAQPSPDTVAGSFIDLAGELRDEARSEDIAFKSPRDKYGMDVFSAFKKGVDQQISKEDSESHYSLGIAYKEMGLLDDAIGEFLVASRAPERRADCLTLQGICYRDKGDLAKAMEIFAAGSALEGLTREETLNFKYELALCYELTNRRAEALSLYREIHALQSDFRDTSDKVATLSL